MSVRTGVLLAALALASAARAADGEAGLRTTGSAELWAYGTAQDRAPDSPLNPANQVARVPSLTWTGEVRGNLRLATEGAEAFLAPRLFGAYSPGLSGAQDAHQGYLSQAFARLRLDGAWTLTAGRELLTWGPANFRSPSNPFYFDAGRTEPLRDVPGVDLARLTRTRGPLTLMLARVQDAGHLDPAVTPERVNLAKADLRGQDSLLSVIAATPVWGAPFLGSFAQATLGQAWLVYGEIGTGRRPWALAPGPPSSPAPFSVQAPSPRRTTVLLGASYTLLNGQSIGLEGLRDGHGFSREDERQFFARATLAANGYLAALGSPQAPLQLAGLGQGLAQAPALLGRDYASLLWQSNPQETGRYWRLMWTVNLQDSSSQVTGYGEKSLADRFSAFLAVTRNLGGAGAEFGDLVRTSLTLGIKYFAF